MEHIDGIADGEIRPEVWWNLLYESPLIQPVREVIDVNIGNMHQEKYKMVQ